MTTADFHTVITRDDSEPGAEDASLVIVCACGRSFVGFGGDRVAMCDWQHRHHIHEASEAHSSNNPSGNNHDTAAAPPVPAPTLWDSEIRADLIRHINETGALGVEQARSVLAEAGVEDVQFNRVIKSLLATKDYYRAHGWLIAKGEVEPASPPPAPTRRELHPNDDRLIEMVNAGAAYAEIAAELSIPAGTVHGRVQRLRSTGHLPSPGAAPSTPTQRPTGRYRDKPGRKPIPETSAIYRALRDGRNRQEIADEFDVPVMQVHKIAYRFGLSKTIRTNIDVELIRRLASEGLDYREIMARTGYSQSTVSRNLRKWREEKAA